MIIKCDNDCDLNIFKILVKYINDCSSTSDCLQVAEINIYILQIKTGLKQIFIRK